MPLNKDLLEILQRISEGQSKLVTLQRFDLSNVNLKEKDEDGKTYLHHAAIILKGLLMQLSSKEIKQEDKNVVEQRVAELVKAMEYLIQKGVPVLEEDKDGDKFTKGLTGIENVHVDKLLILEEFEKISSLCTKGAVKSGRINGLIDRIRKYNNNSRVSERINISAMKNQSGLILMEVIIGAKFPTNFRESDYTFINTILKNSGDMFNFRYVNDKGQTFLHMAAEKKLLDVLPLFIVRGVDKSAKDSEGKTYDEYLTEQEKQTVEEKVKKLESQQGIDEAFRLIDFGTIDEFKRYIKEHNTKFTNTNSEGVALAEYAAEQLSVEVVKHMIEEDPTLLTRRFRDDNTLLHIIMNSNVVDDKARQDLIEFIFSKETKPEFINAKNRFNDTALSTAVEKNMYEETVKLIESGVDINFPSGTEGLPPLFILVRNICAMSSTDFRLLTVLIKNGAKKIFEIDGNKMMVEDLIKRLPNTSNEYKSKLLEVIYPEKQLLRFINEGNCEDVKTFFENNSDIKVDDIITDDDTTIFQEAILSGNIEMAEILLKNGANVNKQDRSGYTALMVAANVLYRKLKIEFLPEGDWDPEYNKKISSIKEKCLKIIRCLLDNGADPNLQSENGKTALMYLRNEDYRIAEELLKRGADPNLRDENGMTALMHLEERDCHIAEELLKRGADPNLQDENGMTALDHAATDYKIDLISVLLKSGINRNKNYKRDITTLNGAIKYGHSKIVKTLLELGEDPNSQDQNGMTPLMHAIQCSIHYSQVSEIVELLIKSGANIFIKDKDNKTVFEYLSEKGLVGTYSRNIPYPENILFTYKIDIDSLTIAIKNRDIDQILRLINEDRNLLFLRNEQGQTPLEVAVSQNDSYPKIVNVLLKLGADISIKDSQDKTAADYAKTGKIKELLQKEQIKQNIDKIKEYIGDPSFISAKLVQEAKSALKRTENKFAMWRTKSRLEILKSLQRIRELLEKSRKKDEFMSIAEKIKNGEFIEDESNIVWDATDEAGNTLLHLAVRAGNTAAVSFLINKVDVNICNNMGHTPLFMAATNKNGSLSDIILILKEHNAKMTIEDNKTTVGYRKVFSQHCKTREGRRLIKGLQKKVDSINPPIK